MQVPAREQHHLRFGPFTLDLESREIKNNGHRIHLQEKPFEILAILLEQPGKLVTRDELRHRLWPEDTFVDFDHGINTAVRKLREALSDDAEQPFFIETAPKRGYRFIATVDETSSPSLAASPFMAESQSVRQPESPRRSFRRYVVTATVFLVMTGTVLTAWKAWIRWHEADMPAVPIRSIAVLPFDNLSGDVSKEYFVDGFTDELTTDLAEQAGVRVVSRTSVMRYKGATRPLPEIARELNVDAVVEGSVSLSEQSVRITVQLIHAPTDRHLWAHSYERDKTDLFTIQSEVAATVAALIHSKADESGGDGTPLISVHPRFTAETYELAIECRNLRMTSTDEGVHQAIRCYQHILKLDPNSAASYAELALCYLALGLDNVPKAGAAAARAIELDPSLSEGHLALANFKTFYERDLSGAELEFERALALNPSYAQAHIDHATLLLAMRRPSDAIAEAKTATELDPFSASVATFAGRTLFMAGRLDESIAEEKAALLLDGHRDRAHYWLGYAYEQKGLYREAIAEYDTVADDDHGIFLMARGRSLALAGESKGVTEIKRRIESSSEKDFLWPYDVALFYGVLGDNDRAFKWLDEDQKARDGWLLLLNVDPRLSTLRSDPRFLQLTRRVGLPT